MKFKGIKKLINIWNFLEESPFSKKMNIWNITFILAFFLISFFITGRKIFLQNSYAGIIIFVQIFLFGIFLKYFSGKIFNRIWILKKGYIKNKWEGLNIWSLRITHLLLYLGIVSLILLHLGQAFLLRSSNILLSYEQGAIGLVFLVLFGWFLFGNRENISFPRHVALTYFLFMIFIIIYDFLLFGVIQITGGPSWTGRLDVPIKLLIIGGFTMIFPEFFVIFFLNFKQIAKTLRIKN